MYRWLPALLLAPLSLGLGCSDDPQPVEEVALADASTEVTFASVEQIGPHHMVASIRRTDDREGQVRTTDEVTELSWQDWDDFQVRGLVDGELTRETIVADGIPWVRVGDRFEERPDAETHRVQLRVTWNMWDAVLGTHRDHVQLVHEGEDIIEGRPAGRYRLELKPDEERPRNQRWGFVPEGAEGTVWLDEASAVRLKAEITTTARRGGVARTTQLSLQRSNIGGDQAIQAPLD